MFSDNAVCLGLDDQKDVMTPRNSEAPLSSVSNATSDSSRDSAVVEIMKLKERLGHVVQENKTLKARLNGVATMSTLLRDSLKEKESLQKRVHSLETVISRLQNRLQQLGASTSLSLDEDEIFYPSMSKSNYDYLTSEVCRLKEALSNADINPEEVARIKEDNYEMQQLLPSKSAEIRRLSEELSKLKQLMESSSSEKDVRIVELEAQIESFSHASSAQDSICQSLSEDRESLQQKLQDTSKVCQELAQKLMDSKRKETVEYIPHEVTDKYVEEIEQLKLQLNEVVLMNNRWQAYNQEQEIKIGSLTGRITELEEKLHSAETNTGFSEEQQRKIDSFLLQAKQKIEEERQAKEEVIADNRALEMSLKQQEEENQRLNTLLETGAGGEGRPQDKEHIEFLKAQIQSCTEDFELERQDREAAQTKIADLENQNKYLNDQLNYMHRQREERAAAPYWQKRQESLQHYQQDYNRRQGDNLVARGLPGYGGRDVADVFAQDLQIDGAVDNNEDDAGFDEIDAAMLPPPPGGKVSKDGARGKAVKNNSEDPLECPRCARSFPPDKDQAFMEHVDLCCD